MMRTHQENLVTPINMTCYLCNESLGSSLCNYCKSQFPFHDLDDNAFKIVLYEFQHGTISLMTLINLKHFFSIQFLTNIQASVILIVTLMLN